jgi:hypothetical protein
MLDQADNEYIKEEDRVMRQKGIIGARVRLLETIRNRGGVVINKGEEATIVQSYRGYGVRTDDRREINRIEHWKVEFIDKTL